MPAFTLLDLARIIENRKTAPSEGSYTSMLLQRGEVAIRNKLLEEIAELIIESRLGDKPRVAEEMADVFYLTLVLASFHGVSLAEVEKCLAARHAKGPAKLDAGSSATALRRRLAPYLARPGDFSLAGLSKATGFEAADGADVVLFSSLFKTSNEFPKEIKALKTLLEKRNLKVKWGIRPGSSARHVARPASGCFSSIIFVAKPVVLPETVQVLVDFLKTFVDKKAHEIAIQLTVAADAPLKEQTFILRGAPERVWRDLIVR